MSKQQSTERRKRSNVAEERFEARALLRGWFVTKCGWPDFICELPDGRIIAVEVKPTRRDGRPGKLKDIQAKVMETLVELGMRCFVSDGKTLEEFDKSEHRRPNYKRPIAPKPTAKPFTFIA